MSLDSSDYSERQFNAYFFAAIMSACAVAGVLWNIGVQEYKRIGQLEISTNEQIASIQRAYRFNNFVCSYKNYDSDLFLRKITNQFQPVQAEYVPDNLVPVPVAYRHPRVGNIQLREELVEPLVAMLQDARNSGFDLRVNSSYRSHTRQQEIYDLNTDVLLITKPEKAARPGYSEHQLGTAVDISLYPSNSVSGYKWLARNAWQYGFVLSYPEGSEEITEFRHEPWHWRYVGVDIATYIRDNNTLFNHEKTVLLPSPIAESTELPYEYTGDDIWVWKSLGDKESMSELVKGTALPDFEIDVRDLLTRFSQGTLQPGNTKITLPIRDWILESNTRVFVDADGTQWLRTTYASPRNEEVVQRIEVLYRDNLGYMVISFQDQNFADRLVDEYTTHCGYVLQTKTSTVTQQ